MIVKFIDYFDNEYQEFRNQELSIFDSSPWLAAEKSNIRVVGVFNNETLVATFKIFEFKKLSFLKVLATPVFMPDIDFKVSNIKLNKSKKISFYKDVTHAIAKFINNLPHNYIELKFPDSCVDFQHFIWAGLSVTPTYTYVIDLEERTLSSVREAYSPSRRNKLVKKEAKELEITVNSSITTKITQFISDELGKKVRKLNSQLLNSVFSNFNNAYNITAYENGKIKATVCIFYNTQRAYYLFGASRGHSLAWTLCMDKAIEVAHQRGVKQFDFEGSMLPNIEVNFREFGGDIRPKMVVKKYKPSWLRGLIG